jgi:methylenetetrahydrofolate--tRNA-(uracil-5-)-methyltransferase
MGMLVGMHVAQIARELPAVPLPRETALGSLVHYLCHANPKNFQPANITFDLLPQLEAATRRRVRDKKLRHKMVCEKALGTMEQWLKQIAGSTDRIEDGLKNVPAERTQ